MGKKDNEITEDDLAEVMNFLLSLPAPKERKRPIPSKEDLELKFRIAKNDDDVEFQEVEDE